LPLAANYTNQKGLVAGSLPEPLPEAERPASAKPSASPGVRDLDARDPSTLVSLVATPRRGDRTRRVLGAVRPGVDLENRRPILGRVEPLGVVPEAAHIR
jgi:hypothetical protein